MKTPEPCDEAYLAEDAEYIERVNEATTIHLDSGSGLEQELRDADGLQGRL